MGRDMRSKESVPEEMAEMPPQCSKYYVIYADRFSRQSSTDPSNPIGDSAIIFIGRPGVLHL